MLYHFPKRGETIRRLRAKYPPAPRVEEPAPVKLTPNQINACPKCGKVIGRGRFMHIKHCKGPTDGDTRTT